MMTKSQMRQAFIEMEGMARRTLSIKGMNRTERDYAWLLEEQQRAGVISRYVYEGITLRWADMRYTPDFIAFPGTSPESEGRIQMIEVKGAHIWDRDIVRFKGARAFWPEFQFEMWQKTKSGWKQKY